MEPGRRESRQPSGRRTTSEVASDALSKLVALGYLSSTGSDKGASLNPTGLTQLRRLSTEASLRERAGELQQARLLLRRALDLDPSYQLARLQLATLHYRQGQFQEALPHYELALPFAWETDPRVYPLAATCYVKSGKAEEGLEILEPLAREHPAMTRLQVAYALLLGGAQQPVRARAVLEDALGREPASLDAMKAFTDLLSRQRLSSEAIPFIEAALEVFPRSALHLRWLGRGVREARPLPAGVHPLHARL